MDKIYEYNGKYYSETDHSLEVGNWGGDLYDLYWDCSHDKTDRGILCEETVYYNAYQPETRYESYEELVEDYFEDSVVELSDIVTKTEVEE